MKRLLQRACAGSINPQLMGRIMYDGLMLPNRRRYVVPRTLIIFIATLFAYAASANDIAGLWKNDDDLVWMESYVAADAIATGNAVTVAA